jgi:4-amino-4-deoxy-L-arabinose transferase-like glycosyltransferase
MEALRDHAPPPPTDPAADRRRDLGLLALLFLFVLALRGWLLWNTEVPARDSIGFIRYALQFEGQCRPPQVASWADVIRTNHQHPGYSLTILAVSVPVRLFLGTTTAAMQLSAQLASGLAAVLLVIPMFYLGKALFDRGIGFWGALLFQCLPGSSHILSDGLSEALFLLLACTALVFATRALRSNSWKSFGLCGVFCGLTYLVRPEGGLLLAATGLVLLGRQVWSRSRGSWQSVGVCGASLLAAAAVAGSPYVLITGRFSNKPSVDIMINNYPVDPIKANQRNRREDLAPPGFPTSSQAPWASRPLMASIYGVWINPEGPLTHRLAQGLMALLEELVRGFHYVAWLPALVGLCWYAGRARSVPGIWILLVLCGTYVLILWRLAIVAGYVSERHIQLLILAACYPAVGVLRDLPRWLVQQFTPGRAGAVAAGILSLGLILALIGVGLPKAVQRLHANRAGYHAAGLWLAEHVRHGVDVVQDRHCWAHFYAGEVFEEGKPRQDLPGATCYLVVGRHKEIEGGPAPAEPEPDAQPRGQIVYHWPPGRAVERADVLVYALPLRRTEAPPSTPQKPFLNFQFGELLQNAATR